MPKRPSDTQIVEDLQANVDRLAASDRFSGVVLLAKNDKILFERAYGFANHAFDARNNLNTRFNLASDGKMFTAVAIAQLAEQGKLTLDDTLLKLVPDYPNKEAAAKITVRELLSHRSGLGDIFGPAYFDSNPARFNTLDSYLTLFADKPLLFEPGTKTAYSNAGYVVLGIIVEHVSGESYYQYIQDKIFGPAGMSRTGCYSASDDIPNLALGYTRLSTGEESQRSGRPTQDRKVAASLSRGSSAGGCFSTVGDMLRFADGIQRHQLVNERSAKLLLSGEASDWAGPMTRPEGSSAVKVAGHAGGAPGVSTWVDMYPDLGYVVVILSNYDDGAELVNGRLQWELTGQEMPQRVHLTAFELDDLAGQYKPPPPPPGMMVRWQGRSGPPPLVVRVAHDALLLDLGPMGQHRFLPISAEEFFDEDAPGTRLSFTRNGKGQAESLSISGSHLHVMRAPRLSQADL